VGKERVSIALGKPGHLDEIQGAVANTLNGARGKWCDIDGQAEGRESGSE
jgi:hypothetical protein